MAADGFFSFGGHLICPSFLSRGGGVGVGVGVEEGENLMQWGVTLSKNMDLVEAKVLWG